MSFDARDFRRALGQFPTGVGIVTTLDAQGAPVGMTISSFNSVSVTPPLVLWSIDRSALSADLFRTTDHFAVNILAADQTALSNRFASRGEDKFQDVPWTAGQGGSPVLPDVAALFECRNWAQYDGGDHWIIVGEVLRYSYDAAKPPLVFGQGGYASLVKLG